MRTTIFRWSWWLGVLLIPASVSAQPPDVGDLALEQLNKERAMTLAKQVQRNTPPPANHALEQLAADILAAMQPDTSSTSVSDAPAQEPATRPWPGGLFLPAWGAMLLITGAASMKCWQLATRGNWRDPLGTRPAAHRLYWMKIFWVVVPLMLVAAWLLGSWTWLLGVLCGTVTLFSGMKLSGYFGKLLRSRHAVPEIRRIGNVEVLPPLPKDDPGVSREW